LASRVWVGDDAVDPLEQAQTLNILVNAGIKTREEARADLGLGLQGLTDSAGSADAPPDASANPSNSGSENRKRTFSLTAYAGFPVEPTFMIWSFDWVSAWTHWPCASTALSTHISLVARSCASIFARQGETDHRPTRDMGSI
jgi:hypothetical protein